LFGITFGLKLMEKGEENAQEHYAEISRSIPEAVDIIRDEGEHEKQLIGLISEERLLYASSMVLGLNDALVELTGALAGFSFAFQNTRLVAVTGLITGVAASLSMATSEYLSTRMEDDLRKPLKAAVYTGIAYLLTVFLLLAPFLTFEEPFLALGLTVVAAVLVIMVFNYYIAVAKDLSFKVRFTEMAAISLGVTALTFVIGFLVKAYIGIDV